MYVSESTERDLEQQGDFSPLIDTHLAGAMAPSVVRFSEETKSTCDLRSEGENHLASGLAGVFAPEDQETSQSVSCLLFLRRPLAAEI